MSNGFVLDCAGKTLDLSKPKVMGILNVTPDSFYEGSRFRDGWLKVAEKMVLDGVDILDIGGESTRPGASGALSQEEELERVLPVIEGLSSRLDVILSVDTSSPLVMTETVKAGAGLINDVRALYRDGALEAAAATNVPVVLMHSLVEQPEPGFVPVYDDVVSEVGEYLVSAVARCEQAGIAKERMIIDPGFGGGMFGKTPQYDLQMLKDYRRFHEHGLPLFAGMSRKSFVGATLNRDTEDRLPGSLAAAMLAAQAGAHIIRVHDVRETVDVLRLLQAVEEA
ncbi:dihydropteroate synthase [uncultured Endozoicomonas sp.]|uniref:dihydropteroate synthase n=1 Tax=uncultured Endozoicomonas sp. TaxID=432652 RepID=UPI002608515C|nr:dihydropteroate synthase [uncultured Endozoicomonas sp.]